MKNLNQNNVMKTIIVVPARKETGKTSSIVGLSKSFPIEGKMYYYYQYGWHDQPEFTDDDKRDVLCYREYGNKRVGFSSGEDCVCYVVKCIERLVGKQAKSWLWPVACTKRSRIKSLSAPNAMDMK